MIQLREKELSSLEFYNQAVAVKQVTDKYHIPLIINDRIDIAMAVQATGVHIGQHDLPAAAVRKVIGENMLLGVSASYIAEAIQAQQDGADYLGVGAMFPKLYDNRQAGNRAVIFDVGKIAPVDIDLFRQRLTR